MNNKYTYLWKQSMWTEEERRLYSIKRKKEVSNGICVPNNCGNKDFRHTEESKQLIRQRVIEARKRIIEERGSYITLQGLDSIKAKLRERLTFERRKKFGEDTKESLAKAYRCKRAKADIFARKMFKIIKNLQDDGITEKRALARILNEQGFTSPNGGVWTDQTVRQVLKRISKMVRHRDISSQVLKPYRIIGWDRKIK
jgi:hypothetical protein